MTATWEIKDATGAPVAIHERFDTTEGKRFTWRLPDGSKGLDGLPVADLPLYGIHAIGRGPVVVTEGEKARDALASIGINAVATVTGAASAPGRSALAELDGRVVYLWPDNDPVGLAHMQRVAKGLEGIADSVRWIQLRVPDMPKGWDAADAVAADPELPKALIRDATEVPAKLSIQTPGGLGRNLLPFATARQVAAQTPAEVEWIVPGYVAAGAVTELDGPIKAAGKTTLLTRLTRAVLDGLPMLDRATLRTPVVYLTEQPGTSLREALRRADLLERDDLTILQWSAVSGLQWPDVAAGAVAECERLGARLLIVDTLGKWAGLKGDAENSAGEADAAMAPLIVAAGKGIGIIVARHERKGGGDTGEAARGSTAFGGAVDIIVSLRRGEGNTRSTVRVLRSLSRFEETPDELVVELTDDGYVVLGDMMAVALMEARAAVLEHLPSSVDEAVTVEDLRKLTEDVSRSTIDRALKDLEAEQFVRRVGGGKRGDPFRWHLYGDGSFLSSQPTLGVWKETSRPPEGPGEGLVSFQTTAPIREERNLVAFARTVFADDVMEVPA